MTKLTEPVVSELLTEVDASIILTVSVAALRMWRTRGRGPRYKKIGNAIRYTHKDLNDFIFASTVSPEARS